MKWVKITFIFIVCWYLEDYIFYKPIKLFDNIYYLCNATFHLLCLITIRSLIKDVLWKDNFRLMVCIFGIKLLCLIIAISVSNAQWVQNPWIILLLFLILMVIVSYVTYKPIFLQYLKHKKWL